MMYTASTVGACAMLSGHSYHTTARAAQEHSPSRICRRLPLVATSADAVLDAADSVSRRMASRRDTGCRRDGELPCLHAAGICSTRMATSWKGCCGRRRCLDDKRARYLINRIVQGGAGGAAVPTRTTRRRALRWGCRGWMVVHVRSRRPMAGRAPTLCEYARFYPT